MKDIKKAGKVYDCIYFIELDEYCDRPVYHCCKKSNDEFLGKVMWEDQEKKKFCYVTPKKVWYTTECLEAIQDFLMFVNEAGRE